MGSALALDKVGFFALPLLFLAVVLIVQGEAGHSGCRVGAGSEDGFPAQDLDGRPEVGFQRHIGLGFQEVELVGLFGSLPKLLVGLFVLCSALCAGELGWGCGLGRKL